LVHFEEVSVAVADDLDAKPAHGIGEVEVNAQAGFANTAALVADRLGVARCHVARNQVAEARILTLQVVIALVLGDLIRTTLVTYFLRHPNAAVVAQRLTHQRQLRLVIARLRDARRMDLREAGVRERGAFLIRAPYGGG